MIQELYDVIGGFTHKKYIKLTKNGDSAIFLSLLIAKRMGKGRILIPDQGGWLSFKKFPSGLNLELIELKTNHGVIDLKELKDKIDSKSALLITNMAGYFAQQPIEQISEVCRQKKALFILDVTDSIIKESKADIYVASFGKWKPVNLGYGGFIAFDDQSLIDLIKNENFEFDKNKLEGLYEKLGDLKDRLEGFNKLNKKIKRELKDFDIIHRNKKGINVIVKFKNNEEKGKIIKYCEKNKLEYTLCPRYIRVNENAVSIEVKRG